MNHTEPQLPAFPSFDSIEPVLWPGLVMAVFVTTAVAVDIMIILATRFRLVDLPNRRSAHTLPTARGGGAAIVVTATAAAVLICARWPESSGRILLGMVLPSLVIAAVGFVDDMRPLRPLLRLAIQVAAAVTMTAVLHPVSAVKVPGGFLIHLGALAWPVTVIWIVGMINAFNFMDGADGMAGLGAVICGSAMTLFAYYYHAPDPMMLIAACTAAATAGFLVFNWQPARVFLGDVGSGYLGIVLAGLPLLVPSSERASMFPAMAMCLWPYVYDPFVSVLRRILDRKNPLEPHREFFFHRFVRGGMSHSTVSLIYAFLAVAGAAVGYWTTHVTSSNKAVLWVIPALAVGLTYFAERTYKSSAGLEERSTISEP